MANSARDVDEFFVKTACYRHLRAHTGGLGFGEEVEAFGAPVELLVLEAVL